MHKNTPVNQTDECLRGVDGQSMVVAAHRYCLGRSSYIVASALFWLDKWWSSFERNTQRVIVRDTIRALQEEAAGMDMDVKGWTKFAAAKYRLLCQEDQLWVNGAVHYDKAWPLPR